MDIKQQIVETTFELFKAFGIRNNTMDDIAKEAGISKKTLYQYYKDKTELIELVIEHQYKRIENLIINTKIQSNDSVEQLIKLNVAILEFIKTINPASVNDLKKNYNPQFQWAKEKYRNLFNDAIIENIRQGKRDKIYRNDINEEIITKIHADRIEQILESRSIWEQQQAAPEIIKEVTSYYIRGLINENGELLLDNYLTFFENYINK